MNQFCEITPELRRLAAKSAECSKIDPELYTRYDVKRGLRDLNGKGVLVGLTEISEVSSTKIVNRGKGTCVCTIFPFQGRCGASYCRW